MHTPAAGRQRPPGEEEASIGVVVRKPCGSWESPLSSADLVRGALRLSAPRIERGYLYWLEGRPEEGGRQVVMRLPMPDTVGGTATGAVEEVSPPEVNVRTRVHEYGGGEYAVWRDRLYYVGDGDRRIHGGRIGDRAAPIVPVGSCWADLVVSPDGRWLFAVEERPREGAEPENRLIAIELDEEGQSASAPNTLAAGHDFYASLAVSAAGDRLAWLAWDHPDMPWSATVLETVGWAEGRPRGSVRQVAGRRGESLFQPRFAPDGSLFVVSDTSGWWNLVRVGEGGATSVHRDRFEIGRPQWVFGQSTWTFVAEPGDGALRVLAAATSDGSDRLVEIDVDRGTSRTRSAPFCSIAGLVGGEGWLAYIAGEPGRSASLRLQTVEGDGGSAIAVRECASFEIPTECTSLAEARVIPSVDGRTTHAFVYRPRSAGQRPIAGERPPLLVKSHGGPTSATSAALDPRIQFWTSRGFVVADVNYAGSTGYGRAYRDLLETQWGVVDVEDCVAVARALAEEGLVDGDRLAISGGSAGGYTTLCALTFHDAFAAGASHYGIGDLEALARDTHKFESRYTDWLVGPLPETHARYVERSPVHHPDRLARPAIFFQGLEDRVVPPSQAEAMVEVLARRGLPHAYVAFEGEQHGFRRAENIRTALDGELYFYSRVFGFDAPRPDGVEVVGARS